MCDFANVVNIYNSVSAVHKNFALLHCVSAYPTPPEEINLEVLHLYQETFNDIIIGYSGHELGIGVSIAAFAMGARVKTLPIIRAHF